MKRIDGTDHFEPGIIYELQVCVDDVWHAFYVGETTDSDRRLSEHRASARNASESSTLVYRTINQQFEPAGCAWRMMPVHEYGAEGPTDAEDEHIMMLLRQGIILTNEKKGNANWMRERVAQAQDMRSRNITSYKEYKRITQQELNNRHKEWIDGQDKNKPGLPADFKKQVSIQAQIRFEKEQKRQLRNAKREASAAAYRRTQIENFEQEQRKNGK
jgi:hypothetical protein